MRDVKQFGLWTSAGLYIAIGVIGVIFLAQTHDVTTDGYGIARVAVATSSLEPHR
jgi:hypothetical protein